MSEPQELLVLAEFAGALDELGIAYAIGGSVASSIYGQVRFTQDVDITTEPFDDRAEKLYELLKSQYYINKQAMYQALKSGESFNVIHFETAFKIDVFVRKETAFQRQLLARRRLLRLSDSIDRDFSIVSPEDVILLKLQWYRAGGCSSQIQLSDVIGVFNIQQDTLDLDYLKKWASTLGVLDLLNNAIDKTG
jgi:hypothetical protein